MTQFFDWIDTNPALPLRLALGFIGLCWAFLTPVGLHRMKNDDHEV